MLERIGLAGESYRYLMRSFDPLIQLYDRENDTGEIQFNPERYQLFNGLIRGMIRLGKPQIRETFIMREILQLRLRLVMGDMFFEGIKSYYSTEFIVNVGLEATRVDILYLSSLVEFLKKYHKEDTYKINKIIKKLNDQLEIEVKKKSINVFDIANTLFLITNEPLYVEVASKAIQEIGLHDSQVLSASHLSLKFLIVSFRDDLHSSNESDLIEAFEKLLRVIKEAFVDEILIILIKQYYSQIIIDLVLACLEKNREDLALRFAYQWKTNQVIGDSTNEAILFSIPNIEDNNVIHILKYLNQIKVIKLKNNIPLSEITKVQSEFEGSWIVNHEQPESFDYDFRKYGRPNVSLSNKYEHMIEQHFGFTQLEQEIEKLDKSIEIRAFELAWSNIPYIPLMSGKTNYSISSLVEHNSLKLKSIKKVLIWCDPDKSLNFSVKEREFLTRQLENYGIPYDLYEGYTGEKRCNKDKFIEAYTRNDYDLIWIMCHGKFNPDDPTLSELIIEKNNPITVRNLTALKLTNTNRRILVLNACQSSLSSVRYNSMGFLGFSPLLTSESQTVIGHLWSVDSITSAVLGGLLIHKLLNHNSPGQSLADSISILKQGNENIMNNMKELYSDFDLITEYTSKKMNELFYSGSALLFN